MKGELFKRSFFFHALWEGWRKDWELKLMNTFLNYYWYYLPPTKLFSKETFTSWSQLPARYRYYWLRFTCNVHFSNHSARLYSVLSVLLVFLNTILVFKYYHWKNYYFFILIQLSLKLIVIYSILNINLINSILNINLFFSKDRYEVIQIDSEWSHRTVL